MAMIFTQTDTGGGSILGSQCSTSTDFNNQAAKEASVGGTPGTSSSAFGPTVSASATDQVRGMFKCTVGSSVSWDAGTWTVRLRISTANMNLAISSIAICRCNSSLVNQEKIGEVTGLSISLSTTGVKTQNVTGIAVTPNAGDVVVIMMGFSNSAMSNQLFNAYSDQDIDSPFTAVTAPQPNVNDSVTVTESVTARMNPMLFNVFDSVTLTEATQRNMLLFPQPFDTVTVTESINTNLVNNIGVFDSVTVTESARVHILVMPFVFDSVIVAEQVTTLLTSLNIAANDTVTLTESVSITFQEGAASLAVSAFDSVTVADDTVRVHILVMPTVNDAVTVTDAPQMNMLVMPSVFDTVTTAEDVTVSIVSVSAMQISAFDTVTVADASTTLLPWLALFVTDEITVSDGMTVSETGGIPPGTINYQGDGKSHYKKRRNRTQELFDEIEATLRAKMRGDVELPEIMEIGTRRAAVVEIDKIDVRESVRQLTIASKGYADLAERLRQIKREVREYEARERMLRERDDEDAFMMMGM